MRYLGLFAAAVTLVSAFAISSQAHARGGAMQNIMTSHGYQRALQESRERYRQSYYGQPHVHHPRAHKPRKWKHRHWRHRR